MSYFELFLTIGGFIAGFTFWGYHQPEYFRPVVKWATHYLFLFLFDEAFRATLEQWVVGSIFMLIILLILILYQAALLQ